MYATDIVVNLHEQIEAEGLGLPEDCVPGELTWVGRVPQPPARD